MLRAKWTKNPILLGMVAVIFCIVAIYVVRILIIKNPQLMLDAQVVVMKYGLIGIFFVTIIAGTVVPLGSPAIVAFAAAFGLPIIPLVCVATVGFTVGIIINYYLAYFLGRTFVTKKVSQERLEEITRWWSKWGIGLYIIFGLVPILPVELLSLVCGLLKMRLLHFLPIIFGTRLVQYALVAYLGELLGNWIGLL